MDEKERLKAFLAELASLTGKYQIEVYGCGCCHALRDLETNDSYEYLQFDHRKGTYVPDMVL